MTCGSFFISLLNKYFGVELPNAESYCLLVCFNLMPNKHCRLLESFLTIQVVGMPCVLHYLLELSVEPKRFYFLMFHSFLLSGRHSVGKINHCTIAEPHSI